MRLFKEKSECPQAASCEMYGIFRLSGTVGTWRARYCTSGYQQCARFQRVQQGHPVPVNLMPNGALLTLGRKKKTETD